MRAGFILALLVTGSVALPAAAASGAGAPTRDAKVEKAETPESHLTLATALLSADDLDGAERVAREAQTRFPAAHGFHLVLGEVSAARGGFADAFYEFQWELLRAGADRPTGTAAARRSAELLKTATGPESQELRKVVTALQRLRTDAKGSLATLRSVEKTRGDRFVLRLFIAEATQLAGDPRGAAAIYRALLVRDAHFVPAYLQLAELLDRGGRTDEAMQLLAKARAVDPDHWHLKP